MARASLPRPVTIPGAAALGPLLLVDEELHAHGHATRPYPVRRVYETADGAVRLTWSKRHGVHVATRRHDRDPWTREIVARWHSERGSFDSVASAAQHLTR